MVLELSFALVFTGLLCFLAVRWSGVALAPVVALPKKGRKEGGTVSFPSPLSAPLGNFWLWAGLLFGAAFLLRLGLGYLSQGFSTDMNTFQSWAYTANEVGLSQLYHQEMFLDYPPGYMYVLALLEKLRLVFGMELGSPSYFLVMKLPSIVADLVCAGVILYVARKKQGDGMALFFSGCYLFCPVVYLNSAQWGQVDSFCTAILLVSVFFLYRGKYVPAGLLLGLAIVCKPQMLVFAPLYLFWAIRQKKWLGLGLGVLCTAVAMLVVALPFTQNFNYLWLLEKYQSTLESYHYFSVNAFNLWGVLKLNWSPLPTTFLGTLPSLLTALVATGLCGLFVWKGKDKSVLLACPVVLMSVMYLLGVKMHERYLFPVVLFLLLSALYSREKLLLIAYAVLTLANYLNCYYVLYLYREFEANYDPNSTTVWLLSVFQTAAILFTLGVLYRVFVRHKVTAGEGPHKDIQAAGKASGGEAPRHSFSLLPVPERGEKKLVRGDLIAIAVLTVLYGCVAFWNLGVRETANTTWAPQEQEAVVLQADKPGDTLTYLMGIAPDKDHYRARVGANVRVESSMDGTTWTDCGVVGKESGDVYKWNQFSLVAHETDPETGESTPITENTPAPGLYFRLTPLDGNVTLNEVALTTGAGRIRSQLSLVSGAGEALLDEQQVVPAYSTYENSTYFDEIYHARTAYEHILGLEPYENTHPTLGKLIIAGGISLFGMNPFGWRFMGALFGVLMLPVLYHLLKQLLGSTFFSIAGVLLFAFDFMHFTQTRIATIDTYAVFFLLLMYDAMTVFLRKDLLQEPLKKLLPPLLVCGIFTGVGIASKWTAAYGALGLAVLFFGKLLVTWHQQKKSGDKGALQALSKRNGMVCLWCCLFFLVIPFALYFLAFLPISTLLHNQSNVVGAFWNYQTTMFDYHSKLVATHYFASPWYEWPLVIRPIWYYSANPANSLGQYATIAAFGNPLLWWSFLPAVGFGVYWLFRRRDRVAVVALVAFLSAYLPWVLVPRLTFIYHYFTAVPFLVVALLLAWEGLMGTKPLQKSLSLPGNRTLSVGGRALTWGQVALGAFVVVNLLLFVIYFPALSGLPVDKSYTDTLRLFPTWYF